MKPYINKLIEYYQYKEIIGVEIGVYKGFNAKDILDYLNIKMLYLIDPYLGYKEENKDRCQDYINNAKNEMLVRMKPYKNKIKLIYKKSNKAIDEIPNNLDFIYIDGSHLYKNVLQDLHLYYPKLKEGGVIIGDDYIDRHPGVIKAVDEFFNKINRFDDVEFKSYYERTKKTKEGYIVNTEWSLIK